MATSYATIEVWVLVDEKGDYAAGVDADAAREQYAADVREVTEATGLRMVKLTVKVPLPTVLELAGDVAVEENAAGLAVA